MIMRVLLQTPFTIVEMPVSDVSILTNTKVVVTANFLSRRQGDTFIVGNMQAKRIGVFNDKDHNHQ